MKNRLLPKFEVFAWVVAGIALATDIRIASEDSQFGVPLLTQLSIAYDRLNLGNLVALVGPSEG